MTTITALVIFAVSIGAGFIVAIAMLSKSLANLAVLRRKLAEQEAHQEEKAARIQSLEQETASLRQKIEQQREEISQKKLALNRLRATAFLESVQKMNTGALGVLVYGILIFDEEQRLTFINSRAEEFLGLQAKDVIGKSVPELLIMPNPALRALASEMSSNAREIVRKDVIISGNLTVEMTKTKFTINGGKRGIVISLYNVTRERMIERLKTEFVSLAAHQLRTPLSAIKWTLKVILEGDVGQLTKEQRELLRKSYASNERMIRLINQLLEVTRIEEGRYIGTTVRISMESLVESVVDAMRPEAEMKGLDFSFVSPTEELPQVRVDVEQIRLVIENLIENAIQYTLPGGKATVGLKYDKKGVECTIEDTGIGIPLSQQDRVFGRFFRAKNAVRMETEGSGLGLYISKNIVEAHGGRIWFESQEGKGSTFYIWLPEAK